MRAGAKSASTPDVELLRADLEPDAAAASERLRLLELLEPEQAAEEPAGGVLAAGGSGELDVVDAREHRLRLPRPVTPRVTPDGEWWDEGARRSLAAW